MISKKAALISHALLTLVACQLVLVACQPKKSEKRELRQVSPQVIEKDGLFWSGKTPIRVFGTTILYAMDDSIPETLKIGCEAAMKTVQDSVNLVFEESPKAIFRFSMGESDIEAGHQARASVHYLEDQITDAQIVFGSGFHFSNEPSDSEADSESVCLHELGHALGLAHTEDAESIMQPKLMNGTKRRSLYEGDRVKLVGLYGEKIKE